MRPNRKLIACLSLAFLCGPLFLPKTRPAALGPRMLTRGLAIVPRRSEARALPNSPFEPPPASSADPNAPLELLHDRAVAWFEEQPGFGFARMPSSHRIIGSAKLRKTPPADDDHGDALSLWAPIEEESSSHSVQLQTLELVSLLIRDEPAVYLTDTFVPMTLVSGAQTRPLDDFEAIGLPLLRQGEDFFILRGEARIRMLGALRANKTCTECHECSPGDLLGAFSYTLRVR